MNDLLQSYCLLTGLNPAVIGSYRGLCALMGFLATYLGSSLISKLGALKVTMIGVSFVTLTSYHYYVNQNYN